MGDLSVLDLLDFLKEKKSRDSLKIIQTTIS